MGAVTLSVFNDNTINSAKASVYKSNIGDIKSAINIYITDKIAETSGQYNVNQRSGKVSDYIEDMEGGEAIAFGFRPALVCGLEI